MHTRQIDLEPILTDEQHPANEVLEQIDGAMFLEVEFDGERGEDDATIMGVHTVDGDRVELSRQQRKALQDTLEDDPAVGWMLRER